MCRSKEEEELHFQSYENLDMETKPVDLSFREKWDNILS